MTLATKNGAIIVKDGQLAEDCACCGGWYCCFDATCTQPASVTVSISGTGYLHQFIETRTQLVSAKTYGAQPFTAVMTRYYSYATKNYNGTHSLTRVGTTSEWRKLLAAASDTCAEEYISVDAITGAAVFKFNGFAFASLGKEEFRIASQMTCEYRFPSYGKYFSGETPYSTYVNTNGILSVEGVSNQCRTAVTASGSMEWFMSLPPSTEYTDLIFYGVPSIVHTRVALENRSPNWNYYPFEYLDYENSQVRLDALVTWGGV